ncbi:Hypothetical protein NGAL_HAMBI1145_16830 [Neorhizobium galegae bv. officinalis]|uniref:Uncharacterized protein n=1 Tax=Neorhizobium galegae bv. officinalis TaxID=323656 RepID=A0A0T7FDU0_NEOGA|nr:Hypothetical protein NGAL_HAMBI1145_16830 [Neorhizobium galegae bv. officinalis]
MRGSAGTAGRVGAGLDHVQSIVRIAGGIEFA